MVRYLERRGKLFGEESKGSKMKDNGESGLREKKAVQRAGGTKRK